MTLTVKELNQYYREVRRHLICSKEEQNRLIFQSRQLVEELRSSYPCLNYPDVIDFLGTPEELASTFMESMDPVIISNYKTKRKRIRISICVLVATIIVALSFFCISTLQTQADVKITREDILIIQENGNCELFEQVETD